MKLLNQDLPLAVLFGRTNVGKSTLFNKLTETGHVIVSDIEGTTRDAHEKIMEWRGREFRLADTGGMIDSPLAQDRTGDDDDPIAQEVLKQARKYLKKCDIILFVCDMKAGIMPGDRALALGLQKEFSRKKKIILLANKADKPGSFLDSAIYYGLGLGEPLPLSAATGAGTGDLLDVIVGSLTSDDNNRQAETEGLIRVGIFGKPNVGKSSLLNKITGESLAIVSPIPHTTREPKDVECLAKGARIRFVDTAGISRQGIKKEAPKKVTQLEKIGIERTISTINKIDIALLVTDISKPLTHQDSKIVEEIITRNRSIIIIGNKWDLAEEKDTKKYTANINANLPFITWAPIVFVSALTGDKIKKIVDLIIEISQKRKIDISKQELEEFKMHLIRKHKPTKAKGYKRPFIFSISQSRIDPPQFEISLGRNDTLSESYVRFIENQLREYFKITGTPLSIYVSKGRKEKSEAKDKQEKPE